MLDWIARTVLQPPPPASGSFVSRDSNSSAISSLPLYLKLLEYKYSHHPTLPMIFIQPITDGTPSVLLIIHNRTCLLATVMIWSCFFSPALFAAWQVYIPASFSTMASKMSSFASCRTLPVVGTRIPFLSHQIWGSGTPRGAWQTTRCSVLSMKVFGSSETISWISGENTSLEFRTQKSLEEACKRAGETESHTSRQTSIQLPTQTTFQFQENNNKNNRSTQPCFTQIYAQARNSHFMPTKAGKAH